MIPKDYIIAWRVGSVVGKTATQAQRGPSQSHPPISVRFDLWFALKQNAVDTDRLLRCFKRYMLEGGHVVTRAQFEANLHEKANDPDFRADILPLIRPGVDWKFENALQLVGERIIEKLPGDAWKGRADDE